MQYSPKLKMAMLEIDAILKKHDIAGFVIIHTPGFSEYLNYINPSYSCAKLEPNGVRFKLKADEVGGREKAAKIAAETLNLITHFSEILGRYGLLYMEAQEILNEKWQGESGPDEHTSHEQQNN